MKKYIIETFLSTNCNILQVFFYFLRLSPFPNRTKKLSREKAVRVGIHGEVRKRKVREGNGERGGRGREGKKKIEREKGRKKEEKGRRLL